MIDKLGTHYSMTTPASVYDEEALTALELAGRTTAKVNECIDEFNKLDGETDRKLTEFEKENIPAVVRKEVSKQIKDGTFDEQISKSLGDLNDRVDNLLGTVVPGSTTMDAEIIDARTDASGVAHQNAGESVRSQVNDLRTGISKRNLIDRKTVKKGYIDIYDNVINPTLNYEYHTEFIPVTDGVEYYFRVKHHLNYVTPWGRVCFYDQNKVKFSDKSLTGNDLIKPPENAKYMRLSFRSGMLYDVKLEEGNYHTADLEQKPSENLVEDYPLIFGGYLTDTGILGNQTQAGYVADEPALLEMTSDFVAVNPGETYTVYNDVEKHGWFAVCFYDHHGECLGRVTFNGNNDTVNEFTVPEGDTVAMRYSARTYYLNKLVVAKRETITADYAKLKTQKPPVKGYSSRIKGIAHRGLSSVAPENTLAAIRAAAEAGFKYVEFDVRYTGDGTAVLLHDETLDRTTNKTGNITSWGYTELTGEAFGDEPVDAGSWFGAEFAGEPLPTLDQAMSLCMELGLHPYVEFKAVKTDMTTSIRKYVNLYGKDSFTVLTSDAWQALEATGLGVRAGYLTSDTYLYGPLDTIGQTAASMEVDHDENLIFYDWDVTAWNSIAQYEKDDYLPGRSVELWTVDDEAVMVNADAYHVTGITSNTLDASQVRYNHAMEGN